MKRKLALFIAVLMLIALLPTVAFAYSYGGNDYGGQRLQQTEGVF